jgi:Protein of unknown function (DUF2959)
MTNRPFWQRTRPWLLPAVMAVLLTGCQGAYYKTMEKLGVHKREILVDRVQAARDVQAETKEQFRTALDRFKSVTRFEGGDLEEKYGELNTEFERCRDQAEAVRSRIEAVEGVSEALFTEWRQEIKQYASTKLRRASQQKLDKTRQHYAQLIGAMKRAEKKIKPVLAAFSDQVLFLKHNLNARAVASLKEEVVSVEADVTALIRDMETSIATADSFIRSMAGS